MPPKKKKTKSATPVWVALQRKIFTRWAKQKLSRRPQVRVTDIVKDISDGVFFINLMEVLSDTKFKGKLPKKPPTGRIQRINLVGEALKFCFASGVQMQVKPSAEDLVDGKINNILALIWAIMLKYIKIGEEEGEQLSAKDALLLWVNNKISSYGLKVENPKKFRKEFHNGMILCAIIHKHRPKMIDFDSLDPANGDENIETAMNAALEYFDLEKYLTITEFKNLDENSLVVYVSEYYYGIAEQRKLDLAARRIAKVIDLTISNDEMRATYSTTVDTLVDHLTTVEKILEDRTIDDTMEGAKKRIADFYEYKIEQKNKILGDQLQIEGIYNNLSMVLAHHGRPPFTPPQGKTLVDIEKRIEHMEECENERNVALHSELNRQLKLVQIDEQMTSMFEKATAWYEDKKIYVERKEEIKSVSEAMLQLKLLDAFLQEHKSMEATLFADINKVGDELISERYEKKDVVQKRIDDGKEWLEFLAGEASKKKPVLDDDLAREKFKEKVLLLANQHSGKYEALDVWIKSKEEYLSAAADVNSVDDANQALSSFENYEVDFGSAKDTSVSEFNSLSQKILEAKYETEYSSYSYEDPEDITEKQQYIEEKFGTTLPELAAAKKSSLEEALALEEKKEELRLEFASMSQDFIRWFNDTGDKANLTNFGFNLEEVEAFEAVMATNHEETLAKADESIEKCQELTNKMEEVNVGTNQYTENTMDDLSAAKDGLASSLEEEKARFGTLLEKMRKDDQLCKAFADIVDPFSAWMKSQKETISESKGELEEQLQFIDERIAQKEAEGQPREAMNQSAADIEAEGITNNNHTNLSAKDVEVQWEQYEKFLDGKKAMLEKEIEHKNLRGITPEQFQEIEENFNKFDQDNSGTIDRKELTACLYSLGEERTANEIKEIMNEYGTDGSIGYDNFKEFMIHLIGDTNTREEIHEGFVLINKGKEYADDVQMAKVMEDESIAFIKTTAPPKDGGIDYEAWIEEVFSR